MQWLKEWFTRLISCGYYEYDPDTGVLDRGSEQLDDYYLSWKRYKTKVVFEAHSVSNGSRTVKMTFQLGQPQINPPTGSGPLVIIINRFIAIFNNIIKDT